MLKIIFVGIIVLTALLILDGCQSVSEEQNKPALEMVSSPWVGCDIGSFVHYKILMTSGNFAEEKHTVLEIRRNQVVLEISALNDISEWEHKHMAMLPLKVMGKSDKTMQSIEDTVTIGGKALKCKIDKQVIRDPENRDKKIIMKTWLSNDVPGGVVRISHDDKVIVEVVDFEKKAIAVPTPEKIEHE